jgi:SAM-dependent methyltransferase
VIVTVMAMHHVPNLAAVLSNFAKLLPEDGHLAIVDLEHEDGSFHGHDFEGHRGFIQTDLRSELEDAGFTDITFRRCDQVVRDGVAYPLFLATSTRRRQP